MSKVVDSNTNGLKISVMIAIIGALLMMTSLFMPYATAKEEHKEYLTADVTNTYLEEIDMTNADAVDLSLVEFVRIYAEMAEQGIQEDACIACIVIIGVYAVFVGLTILLALSKKSIGTIVFDILAVISYAIIHFDFEDRGVIPSDLYDWGFASSVTYIFAVMVIVGAIWLLIEKRKAKKQMQSESA